MATIGKVITFYSYKGGTGRSMALANTACLLAKTYNRSVLMIDWDLEAPGLHRYFSGHLTKDSQLIRGDKIESHRGLIDLFLNVWDRLGLPNSPDESLTEDEIKSILDDIDFSDYVLQTDLPSSEAPSLCLMKAGRFDDLYPSLVTSFQWEALYRKAPSFIRDFSRRLAQDYDYVLIDSRTGLTDTSGICTMLMPEALVAVFTPNRQSLLGVVEIVRKATDYRSRADDLRPLSVFPLPSRIEASEPELREIWRLGDQGTGIIGYQDLFEREFSAIYDLEVCSLQSYFDEVQVQHIPRYAYGEEIAALNERSTDRLSLTRSYEAFAQYLISGRSPWEALPDAGRLIEASPKHPVLRTQRHGGYDVYISYALADDLLPIGSSSRYGWVTTLARNLNTGPGHYSKNLFIDHRLKPGDVFSDDLVTIVGNCTLLLLLLSQNYIDSEWCGKELEHFIRTHANDPDKTTDVFVVELTPFDTLTRVPTNIQNLRKRLIHTRFWHQPADASAPLLTGYPSPPESGPESERWYWRALHELRSAIDSRLRTLRHDQPTSSVAVPVMSAVPVTLQQSTTSLLGTVLLADTTDDLVKQRDAVKARLVSEGVLVLPEGDYVGLTPEEFEDEFLNDLAKSQLFIQLLSPTVGRTGKGFTASLPQLQFDRAVSAKLPVMQWCERLPAPNEIADPRHARLFNTAFLRATNRTAFEQEVMARLRAMQGGKQEEAVGMSAQAATKKLIFVDDVAGEKDLNERLRAWLRSANCDVRVLPPQASLGHNGIDIVQVLKPCRAGITIFADSAKLETVYNRLIFFLNQIAESRLPIARWGVYVTAETVGCDLGLASDDLFTIDEHGLADFVRGLD